jgi:DMSO/TMAO reductase YedYZ molybdopterin-dependent catalytic subunit
VVKSYAVDGHVGSAKYLPRSWNVAESEDMDVRDRLPVFPLPPAARARAARALLRVDGLVARPRELSVEDLSHLPREGLDEAFVCEEGWSVPGLRWAGVRLAEVLALAQPLPGARYVRAASGDWVVPIALSDAPRGMICDELNGEPLTLEHGAPWRLVLSGGACYTNVKWLDHLELVAEPGEDAARRIALSRI